MFFVHSSLRPLWLFVYALQFTKTYETERIFSILCTVEYFMRSSMNYWFYLENEVSFGGVVGYCGSVRQVDKLRAVVIRI